MRLPISRLADTGGLDSGDEGGRRNTRCTLVNTACTHNGSDKHKNARTGKDSRAAPSEDLALQEESGPWSSSGTSAPCELQEDWALSPGTWACALGCSLPGGLVRWDCFRLQVPCKRTSRRKARNDKLLAGNANTPTYSVTVLSQSQSKAPPVPVSQVRPVRYVITCIIALSLIDCSISGMEGVQPGGRLTGLGSRVPSRLSHVLEAGLKPPIPTVKEKPLIQQSSVSTMSRA
ncbi:hypothetical protein CB1_000849019 [Camelus ferus]|nr:hypothetical protein CB1_000849019 [Camelus ferus]